MAQRSEVRYIRFFTEGSAAPQVAPLVREDPSYMPRVRKHRKKLVYVDPIAILGIVVSLALMICMFVGVQTLKRSHLEVQQMESYVENLGQEKIRLTEEYHAGYNPQVIEKTARAMGMVDAEELPSVSMEVVQAAEEIEPVQESVWQKLTVFLTGLFA